VKIIILDTETTGILQEDRICQLSYLVVDIDSQILELHNELCKPPLDIKFDAMAVHHITPDMVETSVTCKETLAFKRLGELNIPENLLVIQNAKFDLDMLAKEGFTSQMQLVDTFRILRAKYPLDFPHGLQYKRYQWGLYKAEQAIIDKLGVEIKAHDALGDVIVLKNLFDRLLLEQSLEDMIGLCKGPILLEYMPMGKFKGMLISELVVTERSSLQYMLDKMDLDEDLLYTLNYYLDASTKDVIITFGFGKYKGQTPEQVAQTDKGYLQWARDKAENISSELKEEINKVLEAAQ
jgi:exodeoxyribonuclease X